MISDGHDIAFSSTLWNWLISSPIDVFSSNKFVSRKTIYM